MKLLGEPISTWISISALLISFFTLLYSRRKQNYDERLALAEQIANIKLKLIEGMQLGGKLLIDLDLYKSILSLRDNKIEEKSLLDKCIVDQKEISANMKFIYDKLGRTEPATKDPLKLISAAIDVDKMIITIRDMRKTLITLIADEK